MPSFDTYQPIIDRMPFGALPANFGQEPVNIAPDQSEMLAQAEQQKLAAQVNVSAVNITPAGQTAVGFTDLAAKPPVNYFLRVGASADGWTVVSADFDKETVSLLKDGITIPLKLGKGNLDLPTQPGKPPAAGSAPPSAPAAALGRPDRGPGAIRRFPSLMGGAQNTPAGLIRAPGRVAAEPAASPAAEPAVEESSYTARLQERLTQKTAEQQAAEQRRKAELEKLVDAAAQRALRREVEDAQAAAAAAAPQPEQPVEPPLLQELRQPAEGALE